MASRFVVSIDNKYVQFIHSSTRKPVFNRSIHEAQKFDWYAEAEKFIEKELGGKGDIETY